MMVSVSIVKSYGGLKRVDEVPLILFTTERNHMRRLFLLLLLSALSASLLSYGMPGANITVAPFHNDIKELLNLKDEPLIQQLKPLINTCRIFVNGTEIIAGQEGDVPLLNQKCTITITARLDYFDPIFDLNFFIKQIGSFIRGHLIFSYEITPDDLHYVQTTDNTLRISNIIIDLIGKIDKLNNYRTEFIPTDRSAKITILDR